MSWFEKPSDVELSKEAVLCTVPGWLVHRWLAHGAVHCAGLASPSLAGPRCCVRSAELHTEQTNKDCVNTRHVLFTQTATLTERNVYSEASVNRGLWKSHSLQNSWSPNTNTSNVTLNFLCSSSMVQSLLSVYWHTKYAVSLESVHRATYKAKGLGIWENWLLFTCTVSCWI